MILVSACLAGIKCAWDGKDRLAQDIKELVDTGKAIALCPEVLGGRPIPRMRTEIKAGSGENVLDGNAKVYNEHGEDVTGQFLKGADKTLELAQKHHITEAQLKSKSPSCGYGLIYDGTFSGKLIKGNGVTAALLVRNGIKVSCRGS
jgi:uncharacterized protein YbbK (DUF523 family)